MARQIKKCNGPRSGVLGIDIPYPCASMLCLLIGILCCVGMRWRSHKHITDSDEPEDTRFEEARANLFSLNGGSRFSREAVSQQDPNAGATKRKFGDVAYWDKRYAAAKSDHYDWYSTWNSHSPLKIRPHVLPFMPPHTGSILQIGCGNSRLAEELFEDGYHNVMNIDFSPAVVDRMAKKLSGLSGVQFLEMDASAMRFDDLSFDAVFEKGTLDAMYAGSPELVPKVVAEVFRVLRIGGLFVSVSTAIPETRKELNMTGNVRGKDNPAWSEFRVVVLGEPNRVHAEDVESRTLYLYLMTKGVAE